MYWMLTVAPFRRVKLVFILKLFCQIRWIRLKPHTGTVVEITVCSQTGCIRDGNARLSGRMTLMEWDTKHHCPKEFQAKCTLYKTALVSVLMTHFPDVELWSMNKLSNMFLLKPDRKVHMTEMSVNLPTIFCIFSSTDGTFNALGDRVYCFLFLSAGSDQLLMVELKKISRTIPFFNNESFLKFLQFVASFMLTSLQSFT